MATPAYQGPGQPPADVGGGGLFGRFGSLFGGITPSYAGVGQPAPVTGALGGSAVAYAPAPSPAPKPETSTPTGASQATSNEEDARFMTCPIDPEALASGHIAIVIPRERLGPCVENT